MKNACDHSELLKRICTDHSIASHIHCCNSLVANMYVITFLKDFSLSDLLLAKSVGRLLVV